MNWLAKILHRTRIATVLLVALTGPALAQTAPASPFVPAPAAPAAAAPASAPPATASSAAAPAQTPEQQQLAAYLVTDVPVDVTADNAVHARDKAMAAGEAQALQTLLTRLTSDSAHGTLPTPSADKLQNLVLAVSVSSEKASSVRYIAKINVQFMPSAIQKMLQDAGIQYTSDTRTVIVLPVYRAGGGAPVLWEEPNPWRAVWAARNPAGLVKLEVPPGDLEDVQAIDAGKAAAADADSLHLIAQRYGADEAIVVIASMGESGVAVTAKRADGTTVQATVRGNPGETPDQMLGRAADAIDAAIQGGWKQQALAYSGPTQDLVVLAPVESLKAWLSIKARLGQVGAIRGVDVQAMAADRVQAVIHYGGTQPQLNDLLTQQGLSLQSTGTFWLLKDSAAP